MRTHLSKTITGLSLLIALVTLPRQAKADEIGEWLQAATAIFLRHESGHYISGNGGNPAVQPDPPPVHTEASYAGDSLKLIIGPSSYPATGMPTNSSLTGSSSTGFFMSGRQGIGLGYELSHRPKPDWRTYSETSQYLKNGKSFWALPETARQKYQVEYKKWVDDVNRKEASVAGAGFVAQQAAIENSNLTVPVLKKALKLSGFFKAGYVAYHYLHRANTGDITRMSYAVPEQLIVSALLISAGSDLLRGNMDNPTETKIGFLSDLRSGAVGLAFSGVF